MSAADPPVERDSTSGFGPSALATPANAVTVVRILLAPVAFGLIVERPVSWITWALWVALAGSDGIDGWLARRHGTTRSGAFLDPLADKVLVLGGLVALVSVDRFGWVPVALVAGRELVISLYRTWWGRRGIAVPASELAKLKTLVQSLAIGLAVWPPVDTHAAWVADTVLWVAVALTLWSAAQYVLAGARARSTAGSH
jgi:CDP-diacylglycerol---glycerol-3-phosphate 3-phosphatidyltransferase